MQNFKKYGVAAAVAAVSTSAFAQVVSTTDRGDAAIIPYYTAEGGRITGIHVVNTTGSTQAVKMRLRRGSDSADAMDFNIVMSPYDEWTGYVAKDDDGVYVGTSDKTCTVPKKLGVDGIGRMPATFAAGASEGYIEIIGMAQTTNEKQPVAVAAKHAKGVPADCTAVESNFLRVAEAKRGEVKVAGVHNTSTTSNGKCATASTTVTACFAANISKTNVTSWTDTADNALKVSYFIREGATDGEGGLELGANAVMLEGFTDAFSGSSAGAPAMTNQVQRVFDSNNANKLVWDPLNFEYPNLGQVVGNTSSSILASGAPSASNNLAHFDKVREALDVASVINEWADNANADADWIVTLPGQYAMRDAVCERYAVEGPKTACSNYTASTSVLPASGRVLIENDQLPFWLLDGSGTKLAGTQKFAFSVYDREEGVLVNTTSTENPGIDFSPSSNETTTYENRKLYREVNVLVWGEDDGGVVGSANYQPASDTAAATDTSHGLMAVIGTGDLTEGWAKLDIYPGNTAAATFQVGNSLAADALLPLAREAAGSGDCSAADTTPGQSCYGTWTKADEWREGQQDVAVVGLAVWKREFADNAAANYGRAIEHSYAQSSGSCGYGNRGTEDTSGATAARGSTSISTACQTRDLAI